MDVLQALGENLESRWRERNYAARAFPELATAMLESADELNAIGTREILHWIATAPGLPAQQDARSAFSDLALTVYETPRFFVSVLMWLDGTTAIHQHGFSGAFRVLAGGSLHARYRFVDPRPVNDRFRLGRLERAGVQLLTPGSVHPIESGEKFIHSLFHLERPSVTLVVRTRRDDGGSPQWSYHAPGIAFDPFFDDPVTTKKLEAVRVLLSLEADVADAEIGGLLASSDLQTTYQVLSTLFHQIATNPLKRAFGADSGQRFERWLGAAGKRHGSAIDLFWKVFEEQRRQREIVEMRGSVTHPDHRFLLALLLNVPDREAVLELIAARYPQRDPVDLFVDCVEELSRTRELGSPAPNVLRIPDFDADHLIVLARWLRGGSLEDAAADLRREFPADSPDDPLGVASRIMTSFRQASLLRGLFAEP